jgi:hypothetical protein
MIRRAGAGNSRVLLFMAPLTAPFVVAALMMVCRGGRRRRRSFGLHHKHIWKVDNKSD